MSIDGYFFSINYVIQLFYVFTNDNALHSTVSNNPKKKDTFS